MRATRRTARIRAAAVAGLSLGVACGLPPTARVEAQMALPAAAPPDGAKLFKTQCATCHTLSSAEASRQGPTLEHVVGRKAGSVADFHYSAGFAKADWSWDESHLDAWLTNPQAVIPGAIMPYKQAKAETRAAIIAYLKDQK